VNVTVRVKGRRGVTVLPLKPVEHPLPVKVAPPKSNGQLTRPTDRPPLTRERLVAKIARARGFGRLDDVARLEAKFERLFNQPTVKE
jgi:hypothetical protein